MMISFPGLSKLKTKPIVYEDVFPAGDLDTLQQLRELSSMRKAIADSINRDGPGLEAIAREMSGGLTSRYEQDIQKLEQYLPQLENFFRNMTDLNGESPKVSCWISDLQVTWSTALMPPTFGTMPFYKINNVFFELGMAQSLYAALLHDRALEVLSSDLVQSATLFRKAAGVYKNLAKNIFVYARWYMPKPPEIIRYVCNILSFICLAEAQAVTARKAEENGNSESLLAKLHFGVREFLVEASRVHIHPGECSYHLRDFLLSALTLHELMCYKYFVQSLKNDGKISIAIAILRRALAEAQKRSPREASWRSVYKQLIDESKVLLQKYEYENECVWYQKIPSSDDDLPKPQPARIVAEIPYQPSKLTRKLVFKL